MRAFLWILGGLASLVSLMLVFAGLGWINLTLGGWLGAKQEAIRTDIVEESLAYTRGMQRELGRLSIDYLSADTAGRVGIAAYVRDTFSEVDTSEYPSNLQQFLIDTGAR